jgi:hypothetical protein
MESKRKNETRRNGWMDHARAPVRSPPPYLFFHAARSNLYQGFPIDSITSFGRVIWRKEGNQQWKKLNWTGLDRYLVYAPKSSSFSVPPPIACLFKR